MGMKKFFAKCKQAIRSKKFWVGTTIVVAALVLTIVALINYPRTTTYQMALDNIAEARFYLKTAAADNPLGNVQLYSGIRESDYQADGIATPSQAFTVLSIEPKDQKLVFNGCITTEVAINDAAPITVVLEKNPYGNNYAADLEQALDENAVVKITGKAGDATVGSVELTNVMPAEAIGWETALEIACQELKDQITTDTRVETTTKILCDSTTVNTPYWFVSFITETGDRYFVVVDTAGKVVGTSEENAK